MYYPILCIKPCALCAQHLPKPQKNVSMGKILTQTCKKNGPPHALQIQKNEYFKKWSDKDKGNF